MKTKEENAKEYVESITQNYAESEETIRFAEKLFLAGYEVAEKDAREKAVEAFNSALSMFVQGGISHYEARLIFEDKYDYENS